MNDLTNRINDAYYQHTIRERFTIAGRGLHSGLRVIMNIMPAEPNTGYIFVRRDVEPENSEVQARWYNVTDTRMSTTIANNRGTRVSTVEHLLAALHSCGIDNAHIVLDAPELPIMDGSAEPYCSLIRKVGRTRQSELRRAIVITKPVRVKEFGKTAELIPSNIKRVNMKINFDNPVIGVQSRSLDINEEIFCNEIAPARTFGFEEQLDTLKKIGLAKGGSLKNAILVKGDKVVNEEGLRFADEFVRHKILDCIGDLSLAGAHIIGEFIGNSSGHQLNNALISELMMNNHCWQYTTLKDAVTNWSRILLGQPGYELNAMP